MKELSMEEKAKAYDEALHKAKRIINVCVDDNTECRSMTACIQQIFPELKESEDERIRKALIDGFKRYDDGALFNGCLVREILAWLEKQGQTFTKKDVDDAYLKGICDAKHELEKQGEKVKPIEGFDTEFERQVSCLIASAMNKDYEYTKDFVKWTSDALLNYAKLEIEKNSMGISEATKQKLEDNLNKALEKETPESWNKFLEKHVSYRVLKINNDDTYYGVGGFSYKTADELFHTKEELLKSL